MDNRIRDKEEQRTSTRAKILKCGYFDTRNAKPDYGGIQIDASQLDNLHVIPLAHDPISMTFGFTQNTKRSSLNALKDSLPQVNIKTVLISESGYKELYEEYFERTHPEDPLAFKRLSEQDQIATVSQKDLFSTIAQQAFDHSASDIHIEPGENEVIIRYRIDGVLQPITSMPYEKYQILLTDIQTRGGIKWNAGYAQTGRISEVLESKTGVPEKIDMRLETIPTLHGTDIVIRIFNLDVQYLDLDHAGLSKKQAEVIIQLITHPHGMVLMVGPTGSGKTSTQYAILNRLNGPDVKIITLEDPVEYELKGVAQIPVYSIDGESFADKFRSVLREDPDIIMLGEIRDADTAKTALQAALTGHLVLSTFHASSAAAAVSRMMDMIGQNPLLASSVRLIMAQRLLRKLCEKCKEPYKPSAEEVQKIQQELANLPQDEQINVSELTLYRAKGCEECNNIGYKGRTMVAEQLKMTPAMEKFIGGGTAETTTEKIHELAVKDGMTTIFQEAVLKVIKGITSLQEVYRVLDE